MRWVEPALPLPGEIRIVRKFLYLPLILGRERRWLEFANIVEMYDGVVWETICFEDEKTSAMEWVEAVDTKRIAIFSKYQLLYRRVLDAIGIARKQAGVYDRSRLNLTQKAYLKTCCRRMLEGYLLVLEGIIVRLANDGVKKQQLPGINSKPDELSEDCSVLERIDARIDRLQQLVGEAKGKKGL